MSISITEPVIDSISVNNISCYGDNNGEIIIYSATGTQYSIDNGTSFQASNTFTGLSDGIYDIIVEDAAGCQVITQDTITQPEVLSLTGSVEDVCIDNDGTASVIVTGGTEPFTYLWSNGETNDTIPDLSAGSYAVTVTDYNACVDTLTVIIGNIVYVELGDDASICEGESLILNAGSGYTSYLWSDTTITDSILIVQTSGTYYITVTDMNSCVAIDDVTVTVNPLPAADAGTDVSICEGSTTILTATGGDSYKWSTGDNNAQPAGIFARSPDHIIMPPAGTPPPTVSQVARPVPSEVKTLSAAGVPPVIFTCPATSSFAPGVVVPMPTLPALIVTVLSAALYKVSTSIVQSLSAPPTSLIQFGEAGMLLL
ncbi:unnamed protein product [marine sediment metagenome]|uniref:Ig-like domain-containing protein n=1 Tax=marine sediment metagenome TaxID=412755 RepID=X1JPF0_9ZZZZ